MITLILALFLETGVTVTTGGNLKEICKGITLVIV
jgi:hypothetical protein